MSSPCPCAAEKSALGTSVMEVPSLLAGKAGGGGVDGGSRQRERPPRREWWTDRSEIPALETDDPHEQCADHHDPRVDRQFYRWSTLTVRVGNQLERIAAVTAALATRGLKVEREPAVAAAVTGMGEDSLHGKRGKRMKAGRGECRSAGGVTAAGGSGGGRPRSEEEEREVEHNARPPEGYDLQITPSSSQRSSSSSASHPGHRNSIQQQSLAR
jgi:hypothetical protein